MDSMAARGCVWDRMIARSDQPINLLAQWWDKDSDWSRAARDAAPLVLMTDDATLMDHSCVGLFDQATLIDSEDGADDTAETPGSEEPKDEIESTRFGRLVASAIERSLAGSESVENVDGGVLWLHSDFLSRCWDAPRYLIGESDDEEDDWTEPEDEASLIIEDEASQVASGDRLPSVFATTNVPDVRTGDQDDPDLVMTWMRTYACQIRLVDQLLEVMRQAFASESLTMILTSVGGFSFGQNGYIARRRGPLRSCHIQLPLIASSQGPVRQGPVRQGLVTGTECLSEVLGRIMVGEPVLPVESWNQTNDEFHPLVVTRCSGGTPAKTSPNWFLTRDGEDDLRLFLKPDDIDDVNDVARLRRDVVDELENLDEAGLSC